MATIRLKEHESFEGGYRRFKRLVEKTGVLSDVRRKKHYVKPSRLKQRALAAAIKRARKQRSRDEYGTSDGRDRRR